MNMLNNFKKAFKIYTPVLLSSTLLLTLWASPSAQAQIGISTPSVSSGELIRASDWNKVKLDLETIAAAIGSLQNQTWESSGADTFYDSGNVGIGINSPTGTLHLFATTPAANSVLLQLGTTDDPDRVRIDEDGDMTIDGKLVVRDSDIYESGGDLELSGEDDLYLTLDWNNNDADTRNMFFGKNSDGAGANFVELMRLTETGRLGVGVPTPFSDIHVNGSVQVGGDAEVCISAKAGAIRYDNGALERCDGSTWDALATTNVSDNLGSHIAIQNLDLATFRLVGEGGTEGLAIDADGEVGIGTDNPTSTLDVVSDSATNLNVRTTSISGDDAAVIITGARTTSTSSDLASIRLVNKDSSPFEGARIALRNGDGSDATSFGDLVFLTNTGASDSLTEKMRILDDGMVGIGTSAPTSQLQVIKNSPAANELVLQVGTNADANRFSVDEDGDVFNDGNYYIGGGNILSNNGSVTVAGEDNLYLSTDWNDNDAENRSIIFGKNGVGGGTGFEELVRINESGLVGINQINPANPLHLTGSASNDRMAVIENLATSGSPQGLLVLTGQGAGPAPNFSVGTGTEAAHTKKFVVTNEGAVGVGTESPSAGLEVAGRDIRVSGAADFRLDNDRGVLWGAGGIRITGNDTTNNFQILNDGGQPRLTVESGGNVGIGTDAPIFELHVKGSSGSIALEDADDPNGSYGRISANSDGNIYMDANSNNTASSGGFYFRADGGVKFLMSMLNNGNVGIGNGLQVPEATLHVDGETRLTGVSSDGTGKLVCIKADQNLGTCTTAPTASGTCGCS